MNNKNNFIVLDFGTATTFDVLIKNTYFGGIIAPGIRLSLNTLSDKATLIPKIDLKKLKMSLEVIQSLLLGLVFFGDMQV